MLSTLALAKPLNRQLWISEAAYFLAEARGFELNQALDNWLEAEIAFNEMLIAAYLARLEEDYEPISTISLKQLAVLIGGVENPDKLNSKVKLVHAIQNSIKHRPCFRSMDPKLCEELECQWKSECRRLTAAWHSE